MSLFCKREIREELSETIFSLFFLFLCRKVAVVNLDPANDALPYPFFLNAQHYVEISE